MHRSSVHSTNLEMAWMNTRSFCELRALQNVLSHVLPYQIAYSLDKPVEILVFSFLTCLEVSRGEW